MKRNARVISCSGLTSMSTESDLDPEFYEIVPKSEAFSEPRRGCSLFTSTGCLVALGFMATLILAALIGPLNRSAGPAARRAQCINNLKQIGLALNTYVDQYHALPPAHTVDANGQPLHSWRTLILPYLEGERLYRTIDLSKPWNDPANATALETPLSVFRCPEQAGHPTATSYLAITAPNGCFRPAECRRLDEILDHTSSTMMVIEAGEENAVPWMAPVDADESVVLRLGPERRLHHAGGTNGLLVDGSVHFFKTSLPEKVRRALVSIAGGERLSDNDW